MPPQGAPASQGKGGRAVAIWRRLRPLVIVLALGLAAGNVYLCRAAGQRRDARAAVTAYLKRTYPPLHRQTQSLQAALAGLIDDAAPDNASFAVEILDKEILPALGQLIDAAGKIAPPDEAARALHREYYHLLESMLADAQAARAVFAGQDPKAQTMNQKRALVQARLEALRGRFAAFYAQVRATSNDLGFTLSE